MNQITEDYVSYETAVLLKEKGFDESVNRFYEISAGKPSLVRSEYCRNSFTIDYAAPTHQMTLKWLREVHSIFIEINVSIDLNGSHHFNYSILDKECKYIRKGYTSFDWNYEQAVEAALLYVLKNLI